LGRSYNFGFISGFYWGNFEGGGQFLLLQISSFIFVDKLIESYLRVATYEVTVLGTHVWYSLSTYTYRSKFIFIYLIRAVDTAKILFLIFYYILLPSIFNI
jgi:hypothetical protein